MNQQYNSPKLSDFLNKIRGNWSSNVYLDKELKKNVWIELSLNNFMIIEEKDSVNIIAQRYWAKKSFEDVSISVTWFQDYFLVKCKSFNDAILSYKTETDELLLHSIKVLSERDYNPNNLITKFERKNNAAQHVV